VITGLIIAVISMVVAWATSFLKPPVVQEAGICGGRSENTHRDRF
jgi:hypothetical protein